MRKANINEEEIYHSLPTAVFETAKEIARKTLKDERFLFSLRYDQNYRDFLLNVLKMTGVWIESEDSETGGLRIWMNMAQLKMIKQLDCIEGVKTNEGSNKMLAKEGTNQMENKHSILQTEGLTSNVDAMILTTDDSVAAVSESVTEVNAVSTGSAHCCPSNIDMSSAQSISVETLVSGCICCPGGEQWFMFTVPQNGTYTIYSTGTLDTIGQLYNCDGIEKESNDDFDGKLNFRIISDLVSNTVYYIRVTEAQLNTGSYRLKVTKEILPESVEIITSDNTKLIVLEKGKKYELPRGENYAFISNENDVVAADWSVRINPSNAGEKRVLWLEMGSGVICSSFSGEDSGTRHQILEAQGVGSEFLYAYDWYERGTPGHVYVAVVEPGHSIVQATNIQLNKSNLEMLVGEYTYLDATVSQSATVRFVNWRSENENIATVTPWGCVTAIAPGTTKIFAEAVDGSGIVVECSVNVKGYYYIVSKTDPTGNTVISYKNALDGALESVSKRANVCVESFFKSAKQIWCITNISSEVDGNIKAYFDEDYGFNARRYSTGNFNCDLIKVEENEDATVHFEHQGNGYYKIHLANEQYSGYYLTLETDGTDVRWQNTDQGDRQLWKLNAVDWEEYEAERVEYHLLCNGDTNKALRVGTTNLLRLEENKPVRGERLSYWNRQKWTVKRIANNVKICTQFNKEYYLCNDGSGNAYVANDATDANSHLTITPYGNTGKCTIRLSSCNLYLTLVHNESDDLYWGKWSEFKSADPSMQLWKLEEQPATNDRGVDTNRQISATTAKILKKEGINFAIKYYATKANIYAWNYDKILTQGEVKALHDAGIKIVVVYQDGGINFSTERGISDASEALRLATLLEQQVGSTIYFGVEPGEVDLSLVDDYFKAVKSVLDFDGRFKLGVYGTASVCSAIKYNEETETGYANYTWLAQSTGSSTAEGDNSYIDYDKDQLYTIKQSDQINYNEIWFDNDTAITGQYGQW